MSDSILHEKSMYTISKDVTTVARKIPPLSTAPPSYRKQALEILKASTEPKNIKQISDELGISWYMVKSILSELLFSGQIEAFKSRRSLFFWIKKESNLGKCSVPNCTEQSIGVFSLRGFSKQHELCSRHLQKAQTKGLLRSSTNPLLNEPR